MAPPTRTAAILLGKSLANSLVGVMVLSATFLGCWIALLVQGTVAFDQEVCC